MSLVALFMLAGLLCGALLSEWIGPHKSPIRPVWLVGACSGIVGARLASAADHGIAAAASGMSSWGFGLGFLVGAISCLLLVRDVDWIRRMSVLDALAPGLALTVACARLGCFLGGCAHVGPTLTLETSTAASTGWTGRLAQIAAMAGEFPDALFESGVITLALALYLMTRHQIARILKPGCIFSLGLTSYSLLRVAMGVAAGGQLFAPPQPVFAALIALGVAGTIFSAPRRQRYSSKQHCVSSN